MSLDNSKVFRGPEDSISDETIDALDDFGAKEGT